MDQDRYNKLQKIQELGVNPYPDKFDQTHSLMEAHTSDQGSTVKVAGRMMMFRDMGKITFSHLQDISGRMQVVFQVDELGKEPFNFLKLLDLGDYIGVEGEIFTTQKGEISILVKKFILLAKALRPMPEKWHGLKDKELAYRHRYLDLISNRETMDRFVFRSNFIKALREFYWNNKFMELETPVLGSSASGALAKPFTTHHNALDHDFFLRIAIETPQKEALVGGFERTFEIGKVFRNEGMDPSHLQEFTMCEHYAAYWNYEDNMNFTEEMFHYLLDKSLGSRVVEIADRDGNMQKVDFGQPWKRVSIRDLIMEDCSIDIYQCATADDLAKAIKEKNIDVADLDKLGRGNMIDQLYKKVSRPKLIQPTFLMQHPVDLSPLARRNDENPDIVDRFQLVVNGWEVVNAYSELVDPIDQAGRFEQQSEAKEAGDEDAHGKDDDFVTAMEHGMPPQSGWGMGIDRIVALLTQQNNLKDVVLFPLMRPEHGAAEGPLLVIGEIIEAEKHEKKDHINICKINLGDFGIKNVVCAAQNARMGLKVVVALPGFEMLSYDGSGKVAYTVEERKTYGTVSEAVMCAPEEIGFKEDDEKKRENILEVDEDVEPGTPYDQVMDKVHSA
ncbi:MAG: lysine--tRNA ligase [Candidatus Gracilibacteria bacterium]|nr:lysine--tRNA ligase [Candidatus Gracilibacteria bacterium]